MTSYEDAIRCGKCGNPGFARIMRAAPKGHGPQGTMIHHVYCLNKLCTWFETPWLVQVNPDGTVPEPTDHKGKTKYYEGFGGHDEAAAAIIESLRIENQLNQRPGYEIRRRLL